MKQFNKDLRARTEWKYRAKRKLGPTEEMKKHDAMAKFSSFFRQIIILAVVFLAIIAMLGIELGLFWLVFAPVMGIFSIIVLARYFYPEQVRLYTPSYIRKDD